MKNTALLLLFSVLIMACNQQEHKSKGNTNKKNTSRTLENKSANFSEKSLIAFMDSVGRLSTDSLVKKTSFYADSVFLAIQQINRKLNKLEYSTLKTAIKQRSIKIDQAEKIFGKIELDSIYLGEKNIPVKFYAFGKGSRNKKEFAISFNEDRVRGRTNLYFFNGDSLLAKKAIYNYYGLELNHYKDADGKTIIYYREDYITGSGIWWNNLYFYKYYNNRFIPVLNELSNGNTTGALGSRQKWLESIKLKTNPLMLKMVYSHGFNEWKNNDYPDLNYLLNDSTIVKYSWDEKSKTLKGAYENSKITKPQILTYYVEDNELLYINVFYDLLKNKMRDNEKRKLILTYLNTVKKHERDRDSK
ncbi:hypothetical protein G7074_23720 [Pedobacter sp. HDW13]|uniref:hypothetical protein n=1 Tax=unclassified Pedobacter TaxID=2628915 RepID=UPI000F59A6C4|nr:MULTISPECIES: hypothetical protein [unclassified Pedobacter]QIL42010.1 hypothetical protein G7074_23720 [Pedobacter sp. HDW13]RQO64640.1 hypothetical protein DBR40_25355 [Pedobacter sp. KBW01]